MTYTQKPSRLDKVNPVARVDVAVFQIMERLCKRDSVTNATFQEFRPEIADAIARLFGPANKPMRKLRRYVKSGVRIVQARRVA